MSEDPGLTVAAHNLALLYDRSGRPGEAISLWKDVLRKDPALQPARVSLADAYARNGWNSDAECEYEEVLRLQPDHFEARRKLAEVLHAAGEPNRAIEQMQAAVKEQERQRSGRPAATRWYQTLGEWYSQAARPREACHAFGRAREALKTDRSGVDEQKLKTALNDCRKAGWFPE
jgi:tetratricopeptide (TPR) repeat protein